MKLVATSMLVGAAIVFALARGFEESVPALGYVRATAEAAMVGALADWFAVTALFRHPLGIPIPHTAIIQTRKNQIGASLGGFVRDNFLTAEVVGERLRSAGLAERVGRWLAEPANAKTVGAQSAAVVRGVAEVLQDDVVSGSIEQVVVNRAQRVAVAPLVGRAVELAFEGEHHQTLLDEVLGGLGRFMEENRPAFRQRLYQESPWWVPASVDDVVFEKIYEVVQRFLDEVATDREHEMRADLDRRTMRLAGELKSSPAMEARAEELKEQLLTHPEFRAWSASLWSRIKIMILDATDDPESELRQRLELALVDAGRSLAADPEMQAKIDRWIVDATTYIAEQFRGEVADLISSTVERWDTAETADRLELQVGRDLQFIRINGTIVGGLAGLVIYTVSELLL